MVHFSAREIVEFTSGVRKCGCLAGVIGQNSSCASKPLEMVVAHASRHWGAPSHKSNTSAIHGSIRLESQE